MKVVTLTNLEFKNKPNQFIWNETRNINNAILIFLNKISCFKDWKLTKDGEIRSNELRHTIDINITELITL